jgi:hypothetical protein
MEDIIAFSIVGTLISLVMQAIKKKHGEDSFASKILVIGLSTFCGAVYFLFSGTPLWTGFVGILAASQTFYALILKK